MMHQYRDIENITATDAKSLDMTRLKALKQFAWMLDSSQQEKVKEWVVSVATRYATKGGQLCITEASEAEHSLVLAKSGMSASAASSSADIVKIVKPIASKKEAKAVDKVIDKKAMMMNNRPKIIFPVDQLQQGLVLAAHFETVQQITVGEVFDAMTVDQLIAFKQDIEHGRSHVD